MISKRVESGEEVDVSELFGGLLKKVNEIRKQQGLVYCAALVHKPSLNFSLVQIYPEI